MSKWQNRTFLPFSPKDTNFYNYTQMKVSVKFWEYSREFPAQCWSNDNNNKNPRFDAIKRVKR